MSTEPLTPRQRQILDYLAAYVADEGFLPTTREVAVACGLRSPTSVRRALDVLEAQGFLVRDRRYRRLGTVVVPDVVPVDVDIDGELSLCELILVEMEGAVDAARRGLRDAPDLDAQELAHREALERIRLLRVYADVRDRLIRRGARRPPSVDHALAEHKHLVADRLRLIDTWDAYCLSTFVMRFAVKRFVAQPSSRQLHLRHAYAAEVAALDPDRCPDVRALRARLHDGDARLESLLGQCGSALHNTFATLAPETPALAAMPLRDTAVQSLELALRALPAH